jgi:hypothetical protein
LEPFPGKCSQDDRAPVNRKVGCSSLPLTTSSVWYENGQRRQFEAVAEDKLAAKLAKVTERLGADAPHIERPAAERKTIATPLRHCPVPKQLDAGPFEAEVDSFRLHLAAEGKAGRTLHTYTEAVR